MNNQDTPLSAIHAYCVSCSGDDQKEVRKCNIDDCPLYLYRFGHNPKRQGVGEISHIVLKPDSHPVKGEIVRISPTQHREKREKLASNKISPEGKGAANG